MPIYAVKHKIPEKITAGEAVRLIKAANRAQALAFAAESSIDVEHASQEECIRLAGSGVRVEDASTGKDAQLGVLNQPAGA